ncbi:unnamed protein product [Symbiodinium sp. CCMP2592]|nr:unnamed protein product [Symbiodinium sp. CCMP2592]
MDRRLRHPPPPVRRLLLLWLWGRLPVRGWQSVILQPEPPLQVGLPQLLGAASSGAHVLLALGVHLLRALSCVSREVARVFLEIRQEDWCEDQQVASGVFSKQGASVLSDTSDVVLQEGASLLSYSPSPGRGDGVDSAALGAASNTSVGGLSSSRSKETERLSCARDDALGSFVGGLVKFDVAKFGNFDLSLQLPWETDFAKGLLDPDCAWDPLNGFKQDSKIPPLSIPTPGNPLSKQPAKECNTGAIFAWAVSLGAAARDPAAERERKFDQGVCMWSRLVLRYSACCTLYDCVLDGQGAGENTYVLIEAAVSAAVGVKSPHTIHKRAASFWAFVRWVDAHEPQSAEKLHEVQVWNFVQFLKASEAPASKASSVISSFRFAHFVLGFKVSGIIESKRICGAAEQQLVKVRKLRQALDLRVSQILELHARLESGALHCFDRALLASILIRLYARARPSDFLFIESVEVDCPADSDYPLLVFEVSEHKGARKVQLKNKLLPILVPMIGVHGKCWINEALSAFKVGRALRAFLGEPEEILDASVPRDLKSILGRHASSVKTTQAIYSRELAAAPVRRLQDLIREIVAGRFMPDSSRSSYFPKMPSTKEAGKAITCQDGSPPGKGVVKIEVFSSDESGSEPGDSSDSESSGSSASSSSSSAEEAAQPIVRRWKRAKVESTDQVWYVHTGSGVLHLLASPEEAPMLLACGRPVNKNYREATREEVGLSRDTLRAFAAHGIDASSKLAYSCGQPGAPLPQSDFDDFIATVIPAALLGEKGVLVEGSLEPSHGLLNAACRMEREGQLRYIAPEQCGTRMYEIQNVKAHKVLSLEEGKLAISEEKDLPEVTCGSALLLQEALKRRGIALQFAGVASFLAHEKYVLKLFGHMGREPPPGHARTSVHQLLTADRQVWTKLIEDEVSPRGSPAGTYPVDDALLPALQSYDVTVALLPRESSKDGKKRFAPTKKDQNEREQKVGKGDGGKGSGKGKGKRPAWQPSVPEAIRKLGGSAQTPDKKRICFSRSVHSAKSDIRSALRMCIWLVLQAFPEADFGAVAVFKNLRTPLHVDINNSPGSVNYLIPVSSFTGGEVWQEGQGSVVVRDELGHPLMGSLLPVADGPCVVDPRRTHCTMPWVGERVLLVAFKPAHTRDLSTAFKQQLQSLGFPSRALGLCASEANLLPPSPPLPEASLLPTRPVLPNSDVVWNDPLVIELFAGNGRVTACLKQLGLSAAGVDRNPSKSVSFCLPADLTSARGQKLCKEWLASPRLAGIFATPPAFTAATADAITFLLHVLSTSLTNGVLCAIANPRQSAQPPASKIPPLVPEHKRVVVLRHPHVPIGQSGGDETVKVGLWEMAWGIPWDPEEFLKTANDSLDALDEKNDAEVTELRARVIKEWVHLSVSLAQDEAKLKASMHPDVRAITEPKRILLWESLMAKYAYPDPGVSSLLKEGIPLVGHAPISGVFKPKFKPMQATPEQVREDFHDFRKKVHKSLKPQEHSLMSEVFEKTKKELEAGWIIGPLSESNLCSGTLVSRRFGLRQGPKVRCIDNLTSSGVNLAVQAYEAPQPQSTDVVASTCQRLLRYIRRKVGKAVFNLLGKAFDLTAAYRQLPVHPGSEWASYICLIHPETHERVYFRMRAMPFGSSMAVYSFLRISHSPKALLLPWSSFFDDYITFATSGQALSAESSVTAMFKLLGWAFAESGDKSHDFAKCFTALGIVADLSQVRDGVIYFKNTEKRIEEIKSFVQKVLEDGRLPHHEALRLRGRCQSADSQIFGRTGKKCLGLITAHAYGLEEAISHELRVSLERFLQRLECDAPRLIKILEGGFWKVYTDAS